MIFRRGSDEPLSLTPPVARPIPVWDAIAATQQNRTASDWFIPQSDHAHISGALAAAFDRELFPDLTPEILEAIRLHDEGWVPCDGVAESPRLPAVVDGGRALSFFQLPPSVFLRAWQRSIDSAIAIGPAAGHIVSSHFRLLAGHRLHSSADTPEDTRALESFAAFELLREASLAPASGFTSEQLARFLAVLQFCDVLSLYLCGNPGIPVVFTHDFGHGLLSAEPGPGIVHVRPRLFAEPFSVAIPCVRFSGGTHLSRSESIQLD